MKIMAMMRVRTVLFYALVCLSAVSSILQVHWMANIINVITVSNIFAAIELACIGGLNTSKQAGYLPVLRAYIIYPKLKNFVQLFLTAVVMAVLYSRMGLIESALVGFAILIIISINA